MRRTTNSQTACRPRQADRPSGIGIKDTAGSGDASSTTDAIREGGVIVKADESFHL
jgi:hypothetical protein